MNDDLKERVMALMDNAGREWSAGRTSLPPQEFIAEKVASAFRPIGLECVFGRKEIFGDDPCGHRVAYIFGEAS